MGAFEPQIKSGTIATVCRDQRGRMLNGLTKTITVSSALQVEFMALLITLRHLQQTGRHQDKLILELDSLIPVEAINEITLPPWEVRSILVEAQFLLRSFSCARVVHCQRGANRVADWAAKFHRRGALSAEWPISPPPLLLDLLTADLLAAGCNPQF